jgi:amino acid transporter
MLTNKEFFTIPSIPDCLSKSDRSQLNISSKVHHGLCFNGAANSLIKVFHLPNSHDGDIDTYFNNPQAKYISILAYLFLLVLLFIVLLSNHQTSNTNWDSGFWEFCLAVIVIFFCFFNFPPSLSL